MIENKPAVYGEIRQHPGKQEPSRHIGETSFVAPTPLFYFVRLFVFNNRVHRTLALVQQRFWWPSMAADVRTFIAACPECARNKSTHRPPAGLLQPLPIPPCPWWHNAVDFVIGLPPSDGNNTILTIVDRFSKAVHFVPLPKLPSTLETANLLITHVFRLHGIPLDIVSDRGPQFTSQDWRTFCKALGTTPSLTSGYHPQSNGQTERANQDLETALRCVTSRLPSSWATHLPWVKYTHNTLISSATGMYPFMVKHGYQPPLFPSQETDTAVPSVRAQLRCIKRVWRETRAAQGRTAERNHRIPAPNYSRTAGLALNARPPLTNWIPEDVRDSSSLVPTPPTRSWIVMRDINDKKWPTIEILILCSIVITHVDDAIFPWPAKFRTTRCNRLQCIIW